MRAITSAHPLRHFRAALAVATHRWTAPRTSLFAAALAFHAQLALAPLLLVLLSAAGHMLGQEEARRGLTETAERFVGSGADRLVASILELVTASRWRAGGTILGLALMLYFASSFFATLRDALDSIWEVRPKGFGRSLFNRVISFGETLLAVAAALVVLAFGALRSVVSPALAAYGAAGVMAWVAWTRIGTLFMTTLFLSAAFRYVPSVRPRPTLRAVLAGALPAALILNLTNEVIGFVVSRSALASLYGAAGSLIIILLWVQYSAWIVLFGAEVCRAWDEPGTAAPVRGRT